MKKLVVGKGSVSELVDMPDKEKQELLKQHSEFEAGRETREWKQKMAESDLIIPRYIEDLIDVLTDEQKGRISSELKSLYENKKLARAEDPDT